MTEVTLAVVASTAPWAAELTAWIADHGGGVRLRDHYLFTRSDVLEQPYDCLISDVDSSLLDARLVREVRARDRAVVGVYDPALLHTRRLLESLGVDRVVEATVGPADIVQTVLDVAGTRRRFFEVTEGLDGDEADATTTRAEPRSCVTVVTGALEGVGASEVAVELAVQLAGAGHATALVDADLVAPSLAQRLGAPLTPNLNTAVDALGHLDGSVRVALVPVVGGVDLLAGLEHPKHWADLTADEVCDVLDDLRRVRSQLVVVVGSHLEDLAVGPRRRHAVAQALIAAADRVVVVADASPIGLVRLSRWAVDALELTEAARVHVVFNRSAGDRAGALTAELLRTVQPGGVHHLPLDPRVPRAAWNGEPVARGPFTRAVADLRRTLALPAPPSSPRRRLLARLRR